MLKIGWRNYRKFARGNKIKKPRYCEALFQTLRGDVFLQITNLLRHCDDSLSEDEIIPFSGVSKSGDGSIAHAAGAADTAPYLASVPSRG